MSTRIHLDTDIAGDTDDLCALVLLLGLPDVELTGVTTSAEVAGRRAGYARYILDRAGHPRIPVASGAGGSLGGFPSQPGLHDHDRYWPDPVVPLPGPPGAALDLLAASIDLGATVVVIGPFTNLALLEATRPGLLATTEVVVMGGYVQPPGAGYPAWGADMDWNVQCDTVAARLLFERCDPILVPINVTLQTALRAADLPALRASGSLGRLLATQAECYAENNDFTALSRRHAALPDDLLNFQHDALACAVAAGWDGVTVERRPLLPGYHERWLSFVPATGGKPVRVVTAVDAARFRTDWLAAVQRADAFAATTRQP